MAGVSEGQRNMALPPTALALAAGTGNGRCDDGFIPHFLWLHDHGDVSHLLRLAFEVLIFLGLEELTGGQTKGPE